MNMTLEQALITAVESRADIEYSAGSNDAHGQPKRIARFYIDGRVAGKLGRQIEIVWRSEMPGQIGVGRYPGNLFVPLESMTLWNALESKWQTNCRKNPLTPSEIILADLTTS